MPGIEINYLAVLAAAAISVATGMLWYSKFLFAKEWARLVGRSEDDMRRNGKFGYFVAVIGALLQAYILAHFVQYTAATSIVEGATTGFWLWLGFVAVTSAVNSMYAGRPWGLWRIDAGYFLVVLIINGALLAFWQI